MRPLAASDPFVIDGPVASRVIVLVAVANAAGPVVLDELVAPFAANRGCTVPSLQPVTVTVVYVAEISEAQRARSYA